MSKGWSNQPLQDRKKETYEIPDDGRNIAAMYGAGLGNWRIRHLNLEITQAIVDASAADQAPAIIMIYPNDAPPAEWPTLLRIIESEVERAHIPAALVLDHAKTIDHIEYALELGILRSHDRCITGAVGRKYLDHPPGS